MQFPNINLISWVPVHFNFVPVILLAARSVDLSFAQLTPGFTRLKLAPESIKIGGSRPLSAPPGAVHSRKLPRLNCYLLARLRPWGRLRGSSRRPMAVWGCVCPAIFYKLGALIFVVTQLLAIEALNLFPAGAPPSGRIPWRLAVRSSPPASRRIASATIPHRGPILPR
jgi:hypothetical protein